jgi:sugar phosphate permease
VAGSFVTYGAGQVVSGIFGDRVSPKKLVTLGLGLTVCMNLLMTFCQNPWQMLAVWSVNGFAQSFMWPPMVKILAQTLNDDDYKFAVNKVSWGSSAGTIFVYLTAPLLLSLLSWRWVFVCSAIMGFGMMPNMGGGSGGMPSFGGSGGGGRPSGMPSGGNMPNFGGSGGGKPSGMPGGRG